MPSLAELQRWLRWIITDPRGVNGALSDEPFVLGAGALDPAGPHGPGSGDSRGRVRMSH